MSATDYHRWGTDPCGMDRFADGVGDVKRRSDTRLRDTVRWSSERLTSHGRGLRRDGAAITQGGNAIPVWWEAPGIPYSPEIMTRAGADHLVAPPPSRQMVCLH